MRATKSRFEVPNRRFKGIWNLIFSKQGSIWGQNFDLGSRMELVLVPPLCLSLNHLTRRPSQRPKRHFFEWCVKCIQTNHCHY